MNTRTLLSAFVIATVCLAAAIAEAQPVGTFRWQLQPYCNVVTVAITQNGGVYRLEGTDDQCGAGADSASVIGTAFPNANGSIGFGLNIVSAPGGAPGHVEATVTLPNTSGTWRDSAGRSGAFVFTPGAGTGGSLRPTPSAAIGLGAITGSQMADATITASKIDPAQVQLRVSGSCTAGLFMQSIGQSGAVGCAAAGAGGNGTITGVAAGTGLTGGGPSGTVTLALSTAGAGTFDFSNVHGFVAAGAFGAGFIGASGPGTRMLWYPRKAAFRAGFVTGSHWDDANIGSESVAFNKNTTASGIFSAAVNDSTIASGFRSFATGYRTTASGESSTAMGGSTTASGLYSTAMGGTSTASGPYSAAIGTNAVASGEGSIAIGNGTASTGIASAALGSNTVASGNHSTAMGVATVASGSQSTALGFQTTASGVTSVAMGSVTRAEGLVTTVMGTYATATAAAPGSFVYGDRSTVNAGNGVVTSISPNQFLVRASGGTVFWSSPATVYPSSPGVILNPNESFWSSLSDVNSKENFTDLVGEDVLVRLAQMPVREWNYKAQDAAIRHVGPTAQDFHAAFGLGTDPRRIGTVDADGIALAAIKALEARTQMLRDENDELRARFARLEALLDKK